MSTTAPAPTPTPAPAPADDRPTETLPTVASAPVRRSILRTALPASQDEGAPLEGRRGQARLTCK